MRLQKLTEGKIKLAVPTGRPWDADVFYNPEAEMTRDLSVACLQAFQRSNGKLTVCDALAGTGARGLRYAKEVKGLKEVVLNDHNPEAFKLIKKNISLNKLAKICKPSCCNANALLTTRGFLTVDIDPFGSPAPFLDASARSIMNKGMLAVTATDTAPLAGKHPEACLRKYGIRSMMTDYYEELGMRIMITAVMTACARYDKAFSPLLSFSSKHYHRVFGSIKRGRTVADKMLDSFGYVNHCFKCGNRATGKIEDKCNLCGTGMKNVGPLYLGSISSKEFCSSVMAEIRKRKYKLATEEMRLLQLLEKEAETSPFYFDMHEIAKLHKSAIIPLNNLIEKLRKEGRSAERTHFCQTAIKTNASMKEILDVLKVLS